MFNFNEIRFTLGEAHGTKTKLTYSIERNEASENCGKELTLSDIIVPNFSK